MSDFEKNLEKTSEGIIDGISVLTKAATYIPEQISRVVEMGRFVLVGYSGREFRLFKDVTPMEAVSFGTIPFAVFGGGEEGFSAAFMSATLLAQGFKDGDQIRVPDGLADEIKWGSEAGEEELGESGNVGTMSDSIEPVLVDSSGHPL